MAANCTTNCTTEDDTHDAIEWYQNLYRQYEEARQSQMFLGVLFLTMVVFMFGTLVCCVRRNPGIGGYYFYQVSTEDHGDIELAPSNNFTIGSGSDDSDEEEDVLKKADEVMNQASKRKHDRQLRVSV